MKIEYDVNVPRCRRGSDKNAKIFWDFCESEHKTAKYIFKTTDDAKRLYKSAQNIVYRGAIMNVRVSMRENLVYFEKY